MFLAYTGSSWVVQSEDWLGSTVGYLIVQEACATPDLAGAKWQAEGGGVYQDQPGIRCRAI